MISAVRACCGNMPGIVSILGTGSNTCHFDGEQTHQILPSMGYLIGDHGSGSYIGRKVLQDYFYKQMPDQVSRVFDVKYGLTRSSFLKALYNSTSQAQFLASFVLFLHEVEDPWKNKLLEKVFQEFINLHLLKTAKFNKLPLHFVGSIAYYFRNHLTKVLNDLDLQVGRIIKEPGMNLVNFHKNNNE
jgi:N-acetylglucosamine kinase-like BadF-type ATPase